MLVKLGVDISQLNREARRALKVIEDVFNNIAGEEAVITSTYEGDHRPDSLHYCNDDIDIRKPRKKGGQVFSELKRRLGGDFDIISYGRSAIYYVEYDTG